MRPKYQYYVKLTRPHGIDTYLLRILESGCVVHTSTHMSEWGAEQRARTWAIHMAKDLRAA